MTTAILVVADDLIWSTRLTESVRRAGGSAVRLASAQELAVMLEAQALGDEPTVGGAVVDLGMRGFDAVTAVQQVAEARLPVIAVAQHDDQLTRKRALSAGAQRVFSYQKFFRDGPRLVETWLTAARAGEPAADQGV